MKHLTTVTDSAERISANSMTKMLLEVEERAFRAAQLPSDSAPRISNTVHVHVMALGALATADNNGLDRDAVLEAVIQHLREVYIEMGALVTLGDHGSAIDPVTTTQ